MQTDPPNAEPPKRKRRWYQFSLRTLFIVVTVVAIYCPFGARVVRDWQGREQQQHLLDSAFRTFKESPHSYATPPETLAPADRGGG